MGQVLIEIAANSAAFRSELEKARGQFSSFTGAIKSGLATIGVAASVAGLTALVKSAIDAGAATREMATRMGIGTRELQELQHAARDTGTDLEALETGVRNLSRRIDEAANDSAEAREAFARLGVSWRDSTGNIRDVLDVLDEVADKLNLRGQAERAALAVQLFGRSGAGMLTLLSEGSKGMSELRAEAHKLGLVLTDEALKALDETQDAFDKATHSIKVEFMKAVVEAKPALLDLATVLQSIGSLMSWVTGKAKQLSDVLGLGVLRDELKEWLGRGGSGSNLVLPPGMFPSAFVPEEDRQRPRQVTTAQLLQRAQLAAAAAQNRFAIGSAASLAAPGSEVDLLQRQITLSQQKLRVDLDGLAAQRQAEITDKGRLEVTQKAEKVVADFIVEQVRLYKDLTDAMNTAAQVEASLFDFSGEAVAAQRDLDVVADAAGRYAEALKEAKRQGLGVGESEVLFDVPLMTEADATMQRLGSRLNDVANLSRVMGSSFDSIGGRIAAIDEALQDLAQQGIAETDARVQSLRGELDRLIATRDALSDIFGGLRSAVSGTVQGIVQGTLTLKEAFANMGRSIAASILENVINRGLAVAQKALEEFIDSLIRSGLIQAGVKAGVGLLAGIAGAGQISVGQTGTPATLHAFAEGGVVTRPTLGLFGESGPEAVIPLDRFTGGGTVVNIYNQASGTEVEHRETTDGRRQIHDIVIREVRRSIASGEMDSVLSPYGLGRQPVRR